MVNNYNKKKENKINSNFILASSERKFLCMQQTISIFEDYAFWISSTWIRMNVAIVGCSKLLQNYPENKCMTTKRDNKIKCNTIQRWRVTQDQRLYVRVFFPVGVVVAVCVCESPNIPSFCCCLCAFSNEKCQLCLCTRSPFRPLSI